MAANTPQYVCRNCGFAIPNPGATCARCGANNSAYANYNSTQYGNDPYQYPNQYSNQANLGTYVVPPPGNPPVPPPPPGNPLVPPPQPRKRSSLPIIAAIIGAIILVVAGGSIFAVNANNNALHAKATEQAISAQNTSVAQVQQATARAQTLQATATAQAVLDPYAPKGTNETLALTDSLTQPGKWKANVSNQAETCEFSDGFHMKETQTNTIFYCESQVSGASYANFSYEVEMTVISGDCGGMIFRDSGSDYYKGYVFTVCSDSSYFLYKTGYDAQNKRTTTTTLDNGTTVGFQSNQANKVAVMVKGNLIEGYLNGRKLVSKQDNTFLDKGVVGLAIIDQTQSTELKFANAKVWSFS